MGHAYTPRASRWVSSAAIVGLIFQAAVSGFALPAHAGQQDALADDPFRTLVICTGQGLVRIQLDAEGRPVEESGSDEPVDLAFACAVCCAVSCNKQAGPALVEWPHGDAGRARFALAWSSDRDAGRSPLNRKGRDPPHPA